MRHSGMKLIASHFILGTLGVFALLIVACGGTAADPIIVEKEVVKEVIKEVVVKKEVIKEVPVEVVVEKEVIKEVEKQVIVTATPAIELRLAATPTPSADQPVYGGELISWSTGVFPDMDPMQRKAGASHLPFFTNLYSHLLRFDPRDRVTLEGDLAESWDIDQSGTVWSIKIKEGITDHEGNPFTVEDVAYTFERWLTRPNKVPVRRQRCMAGFLKTFDEGSVKVVDPQTLQLTLKSPRAAFPNCLAGGWMMILPSKYIKAIDESGKNRDLDPKKGGPLGEVVGTGPFMFDPSSYQRDSKVSLVRNPNYFHAPGVRPYLDKVTLVNVPDYSTRIALIRSKRVNWFGVFPAVNKPDADALKKQFGDDITFFPLAALGWTGIVINVNRPPFDNKSVRQAMQMAMDREEVNQLSTDGVGVVSGPLWGGWDWIRSFDDYNNLPGFRLSTKAEDIAEARKLMESAGFGPESRLKTQIVVRTSGFTLREAEVAAEQLKEIYIDAEVLRVDNATRQERENRADFELIMLTYGAEFEDPDSFLTSMVWPGASRNFGKWENAEVAKLIEEQSVMTDQAKRAETLRELVRIWLDESPAVTLVRPTLFHGFLGPFRNYNPPRFHHSEYNIEYVWCVGGKCLP